MGRRAGFVASLALTACGATSEDVADAGTPSVDAAIDAGDGAAEASCEERFPALTEHLAALDELISRRRAEDAKREPDPYDVEWVQWKLLVMSRMDQDARWTFGDALDRCSSDAEWECVVEVIWPTVDAIDVENTATLRKLLAIYEWFDISTFGREADTSAWLIVQHCGDLKLMHHVLEILGRLYPIGESDPHHYAYLYDRVASFEDRPQRFGTQGMCTAEGEYLPVPLEDPENVDALRAEMGLTETWAEVEARLRASCESCDDGSPE